MCYNLLCSFCGRHLEVYYHVNLALSKLIKPWKKVYILSDFHLLSDKQFGRELHGQKDAPWARSSPIYHSTENLQLLLHGATILSPIADLAGTTRATVISVAYGSSSSSHVTFSGFNLTP